MPYLSSFTGEMFDFNAFLVRGGQQDAEGRDCECKEINGYRRKVFQQTD